MLLKYKLGIDNKIEIFLGTQYVRFLRPLMIVYVKKVEVPVSMASWMQGHVTLSVTEAELMAAMQCTQDILFMIHVVESIRLKGKKPMILEVGNKGDKDLTHNWSVGG
jgi:hypothetical protein